MQRQAFLVLAAIVLAPAMAPADNGAEAEQLFRDAKKLMEQGKYADACDAFAGSYKLDPTVNTLANLAACREKNGQLATAWSLFLDVERATRDDDKRADLNETGRRRAKNIEPKLSYLTVSVPKESNIEGLELMRNGTTFDEAMWNRAIPVDGGDYEIAGRAPGHEEWSTTVTVPAENGRVSVDVPKFKEVEKLVEPADASGPSKGGGEDATVATRSPQRPSAFTGQRKLALAVSGVGIVAVGAGVVFGLQVKDLDDQAREICPANPCARADEANAIGARSDRRALYSNITFGIGGAALLGAAILWFTGAPESATVTPVASESYAGIGIAGSF